ncbi:hypothetical protein Nwat_2452 [Nitrosococcus watsonii C-113]|uniref:Uncharacterized protein n=2 Tax=Nitrosococcus TaxID=1227 RepID=D8K9C0_NITWC|nr:hypothetical protein Nwat_2452 [Nitrosococcus watsonii C-113]
MDSGDCTDELGEIRFTEWQWRDYRNERIDVSPDRRCSRNSFKISKDHLESYEAGLKWESELVSAALDETRKRKFFAINASMILFPGLIAGMLAMVSYLEKVEAGIDFHWISVVSISMFIGMANMITIKYIAAYKAQANLFIRQLNCLRQARDSITYYKFEGKYPVHLRSLVEGGIYYKTFGKHRKLYIGNEELRERLGGSFSESADKSLISFLFLTSLTLISAPFIYLAAISLREWKTLPENFLLFTNAIYFVFFTMLVLIVSVLFFVIGHWKNFKKLRTDDHTTHNPPDEQPAGTGYKPIFLLNIKDYISMFLVAILACYWTFLGWSTSPTVANAFMLTLASISLFLILMCVKKVFFDSLNRIHKSLVYKVNFSFENE